MMVATRNDLWTSTPQQVGNTTFKLHPPHHKIVRGSSDWTTRQLTGVNTIFPAHVLLHNHNTMAMEIVIISKITWIRIWYSKVIWYFGDGILLINTDLIRIWWSYISINYGATWNEFQPKDYFICKSNQVYCCK